MRELIRHILKEETEEIGQKVMNFLMRRYRLHEKDFGWEEHPIIVKTIVFEVNGENYIINTIQNKIRQVQQIFDMLINNNVIEPIELYGNSLDPYRQKIIKTIKMFLNHVL